MLVNGVELDRRIRAARAHLKGQRHGRKEQEAVRALAELLALRDLYRTIVHARFDLDASAQTSLATAVAYAKYARGRARVRLWAQIHEAKRVRVELPDPC